MKKKTSRAPRPVSSKRMLHRALVCQTLDVLMCGFGIQQARAANDHDFSASMERVRALLKHEMQHFLGV
jgi:hypothetical protein